MRECMAIIKILKTSINMRQLIFFFFFCFGMIACNSSESKTAAANKSADLMSIADKYRHAVETKDVTMMDSLLDENYKGFGPSVGDSITKAEAIANWKAEVANLYESIEYTRSESLPISVPDGSLAGDWVSNWALLTIKYKDGRGPVQVWVNAAYKIENGKIVRSRTFYNEADALRQLGYQIVPPTPGK